MDMEKRIEFLEKDVRKLELLVGQLYITANPTFCINQLGEAKIRHMLCMPDTKGNSWQKEFKEQERKNDDGND